MIEIAPVILIPAYNEKPRIGSVLETVCSYRGKSRVVVIDDGSEDETEKCALKYPAEVLRHDRNRGKGAALQTGIKFIGNAPYWIFLDADLINLKHEHIESLCRPFKDNCKIGMRLVLFSRAESLV
ncbi:MAG: glycosyltransferase [Atribacterota bacterium]